MTNLRIRSSSKFKLTYCKSRTIPQLQCSSFLDYHSSVQVIFKSLNDSNKANILCDPAVYLVSRFSCFNFKLEHDADSCSVLLEGTIRPDQSLGASQMVW